MRSPVVLAVALSVACFAGRAWAQDPCPNFISGGVNLRWDHCYGDGGTANRSFSCDTNSGTEMLVASFVSGIDIASTNGMVAYIDIASSSGAWPDWWQVYSPACRSNVVTASSAPDPAESVCQDLSATASGGWLLDAGFNGAGTRQLRAVFAVPPGSEYTVPAGVEVLACRIKITHARTVGASSCGGCATPLCLALSEIEVDTTNQPCIGAGRTFVIDGPANGADSHLATWQGAAIGDTNRHNIPGHEYFYWYTTDMVCSGATPTRRPTWGSIKQLYR